MLELKDINMVFDNGTINANYAIRNLSLTAREREFITVIGSNGSGKSTLLNLIAGSIPLTRGQILLNGLDISHDSEYERAPFIGRIHQNPSSGIALNMTLEENMMVTSKKGIGGLVVNLNEKKREAFREELATLNMGLENRLGESMRLFSGGQRQALTLLMMVLSKPSLILLDEHTAALDPKNAALVLDLTLKLVQQNTLTGLMITHNMQHALQYGDRLLMMDKGEIILDISGDNKKNTSVETLLKQFSDIRHEAFGSDNALLS